MKPCLVDVNAILALLVRSHAHHDLARRWFGGLNAGEVGICRIVQLAIVRLLGNRAIMGSHAVSAATGWGIMVELFKDERVNF
jgi:predicted nucleic acid-binding protein